MSTKSPMSGTNTCEGQKKTIETYFNGALDNGSCADKLVAGVEQAGGNVTVGYEGGLDVGTDEPIKEPYYKQKLCPVNVHWHLGAEHLSVGQYDETGSGPSSASNRKLLAEGARLGGRCHKYDSSVEMYTKEYDWQHCWNQQGEIAMSMNNGPFEFMHSLFSMYPIGGVRASPLSRPKEHESTAPTARSMV